MRTAEINKALEITISRPRLSKYLVEMSGDLDAALALYEYNMKVSEAFYLPLQSLEICLRNTIFNSMNDRYGADWFHTGKAPINSSAQHEILASYRSLGDSETTDPSAIVAEMKFAFWIGLLGPKYDASLWRQALHKSFPLARGKKRQEIHGRLNLLRRFRNRVAHHEPVYHKDLKTTHAEIIECAGWMCVHTQAWILYHSRVPQLLI